MRRLANGQTPKVTGHQLFAFLCENLFACFALEKQLNRKERKVCRRKETQRKFSCFPAATHEQLDIKGYQGLLAALKFP
jgi:hypothetical protein